MQLNFDNFAELEDWIIKKHNAYEELKHENLMLAGEKRELEMDRLRDSDRIAELEEEIYELKNNRIVLKDDCVPNMLRNTDQKIKKSPAGTDE